MIPQIAPGTVRVSYLLFAYQQEKTVEKAVISALAQECDPVEIILSDDASSDRTFAIMEELARDYRGQHAVRVRKSPNNRGTLNHLQQVVAEASGEFIVLAAGDDISQSNRVKSLVDRWVAIGCVPSVVYSDFSAIDESGSPVELRNEEINREEFTLSYAASGLGGPLGATCGMTRSLFTEFPNISDRVVHEDRVLPFRALLLGGKVSFVDAKLVRYRVTGGVSRALPVDLRDYLFRFSASSSERVIEDARQRLLDAQLKRPFDTGLIRECESTIADFEARLAMSDGKHLLEKLVRFLRRGAHPIPLIKHYLKFWLVAFGLYRKQSDI